MVLVVVGGEKQGRRNRRRASILVIFAFGYPNKRRNGLVFPWQRKEWREEELEKLRASWYDVLF